MFFGDETSLRITLPPAARFSPRTTPPSVLRPLPLLPVMPLARALSSSPLGDLARREAVDDVAQARVRAHQQTQKTKQHQGHVLSHYDELLRAVRDLPERAGLDDGGER